MWISLQILTGKNFLMNPPPLLSKNLLHKFQCHQYLNYLGLFQLSLQQIMLKCPYPKIGLVIKIYKWTRNANKSDNDSAHDMLNELNDMANKGELEFEIIPRLETIQNWIARYSSACKREMADIVLQREEQRRQNSHLYDDIIF
ncbi:hypothetical protein RhiirA1_518091 [Rhizophagus irregularis]|uniref:Uncharacterized protein n=1 Tax=Rhizophagus irregularis TaxID=588596 RepID=A0A2N0QLC7_9GLOM|nr:hypothetical protein RhiirA1_518091 [Rhizophagus irregularis]